MSGSGRKDSGVGSKSRYSSLNLSHNYKNSGGHDYKNNPKRSSMQSLGKISTNARRMPAPAQLRSLKSSNDGQDPTITLVPQGGGGWSKEEEKEKEDPLNYTRKVEKPKTTSVPEGFKTNFPSLEEQEKMSKKEKEDLERKHREEENYDDEPRDASPPRGQNVRKPPKESGGGQESLHYHRGGPPQPGPHPQGLYYQRRAMYRQPLPRPPSGRYPHPYHQNPQYRHPYPPVPQHGGYPPPRPPFIDPYSVPPKDRLPRSDKPVESGLESSFKDIKHQLDEEDDGWAGHQEEVDYSKEVVFEDSSDEDSPKKGTKAHQNNKNKGKTDVMDREKSEGNRSEKDLRGEYLPPHGSPMQHHLPPQGGHHPYPPYDYRHPPTMPPYPPPSYPPPPHVGWFPRYHQHGDPTYDDPVRGRGQPQISRTANVPPSQLLVEQPEEYWNRKSEKPTKGEGGGVSDSPTQYDTSQSPVDTKPPSHLLPTPSPDPTIIRNPPKKIMIRDLGDKGENGRDQYGQRTIGDNGKETDGDNNKKVAWGCVTAQTTPTPTDATTYQRHDSPVQTATQPVEEPVSILKERNIGQTSKTLYEPEGRTSQEKFRKYQRNMSSGGGAGDHHTHPKHRKISRTDSKGSEGEVSKSPVDRQMNEDNDHEIVDEDKKRVLIKKTGSDERVEGDQPSRGKGGDNRGWKGDNKRDRDSAKGRDSRHEDRRRGGPGRGGGDRRRDSNTLQHHQHYDQGSNVKPHPHPSHGKQLKSEEDNDEQSLKGATGKNSKGSYQNRTSNTKSLPYNNNRDGDYDRMGGASNKGRNNSEKQDTRGTVPKRSSHYDRDSRSEKYDRGGPGRQSNNRNDVKSQPHSHSKQPDSHYSGKYQEPARASGKSRREYVNNQSVENQRGKPPGSRNQPPRGREYDDEDDNVFDEQQPPSPINDRKTTGRHPKQSTGRDTRSEFKKDTKRDPIPSRQDPIPSEQDSIPSRRDPVPAGQDSIPKRQDPNRDRQDVPSFKQDRGKDSRQTRTSRDQKHQSSESKKSSNQSHEPLPPKQEPKHEAKSDPDPPKQDHEKHSKGDSKPSTAESSNESKHETTTITTTKDDQVPPSEQQKNTGMKSTVPRKPRQDHGEFKPDQFEEKQGNKRRFNTREREDRGRGSRARGTRWGRGYNDYEDDGYVPTRRGNNRRYEEEDDEYYPSRTFDRSKRGGGRGRDQRVGRSRTGRDRNNNGGDREDVPKEESNEVKNPKEEGKGNKQSTVLLYPDLDDIDSPSDYGEEDDDHNDKPMGRKKRPYMEYEERHPYKDKGGSSRRYGSGNTRNYREGGERNSRRNERYSKGNEDGNGRGQRHTRRDDTGVVEKESHPPVQESPPTTKDPNFNKYDINAHNVVVVDRRNSRSDGEDHSVGLGEEGFIQVKSKRDKQKDRDEKRKTDGTSKKGDDHFNRHKGFSSGRGQEQNSGGKGWGHLQKKTESATRDGNGEWLINEGRSAYGAIGDKPSKEKGSSHDDTHKATNLNTNHGYKLFETADKGKNTPFGFEPPISNTPRKGERLQAAIDITLPVPQMASHFDTERKSSNEQPPTISSSNTSATSKGQQLSSTENVSSSNNKNKGHEHDPKDIESHSRVGGFKGDNNKQRKPKIDQKLYTPPAARSDDRPPKGQKSQSLKQGASSRPKVHHHDDPRDENMESLEEDSSPSHHHGNTKKEAVVRDVYLQQHQGLGGGHLALGGTTSISGGSNVSANEIPLDINNEQFKKGHVLKELSSNKSMNQSGSSTKFGSVTYASALKMKSQVKSLKGGGVMIDESTDVVNLLSPKLGRHGDSQYTAADESDCASTEFDGIIPLHDMLREAVLSHSDENEVDGGSTHRYTPSSPHHSEDNVNKSCYSSGSGGGVNNPTLPLSPSTSFPKPSFSSPVGGSLQGSFSKPSPLYSGISAPPPGGDSSLSDQSSPFTEDQDNSSGTPTGGGGSVTKQLLREETRPSSAQSLSDSPLVMRFQKTGFNTLGGSESPSHGGGDPGGVAPLTRVSSAPSHLPLSAVQHDETGDNDDTDSVKTDDSISTNSKSILNIEANEFVPNQLTRKKSTHYNQKGGNVRSARGGYQGQRNRGGGVQNHQKSHAAPHGGKMNPTHFQQQRHTPQQPHPHNQQQSLLNKPPLDFLLQLFLKNVQLLPTVPGHGGLAPPPTPPTIPVPPSPLQTSQSVPHPSLPLTYPPMSSGIPYQVTHPPSGIITQSRKLSQDVPPTPHGMPHPPLPSAPPLQYITTGSKVGGTVPPQEGTPELGQVSIPSGAHPPYFPVTPLLSNSTLPQLPPPAVLMPHPHPSQVHHLPSTRPSHATPINGPQVPPLTIIPSLQLTPRPVMVEQQSNSNSRPPLLPTPPGFNLLHQTSAAATPTIMTPSIHHPNWSISPQAFRMGMPPNIPSHDQASIIPFPHMPPAN